MRVLHVHVDAARPADRWGPPMQHRHVTQLCVRVLGHGAVHAVHAHAQHALRRPQTERSVPIKVTRAAPLNATPHDTARTPPSLPAPTPRHATPCTNARMEHAARCYTYPKDGRQHHGDEPIQAHGGNARVGVSCRGACGLPVRQHPECDGQAEEQSMRTTRASPTNSGHKVARVQCVANRGA